MSAPEISVVVPSHDRPLRLRWLLNALEEQTLAPGRFEVIVAEDSAGEETAALLRAHPLARAGVLRHLQRPRGASPAAKRDAAWRAACTPLVLFTDDDCRPPADWLERALAAARRHPGAIVQGATRPDPDEGDLLHAGPNVHSQTIDPPGPWAETCNILYPRAVLEDVGGFWDGPPVAAGEDTDLAFRARRTGTGYVGAPEMLTYHAIEARGWRSRIAGSWRWQHVALAVRRNPELRREFPLGIFWNRDHALLPPALAGALLGLRRRRWLLLCLPFLWQALPSYGHGPRGLARAFTELPGRVLLTLVEFAGFVRGSIRHRSPLL